MTEHSPLSGTGYNRLDDFRHFCHSPRSNIERGVDVGIFRMPASSTFENALALSVASGYAAAFAALLGSIFRVDNKNGNAYKPGFVLDKLSQLKEAPRVMPGSLAFSNRCAAPNPFEVFNRDSGVRAFRFRNDVFADLVVNVSSETRLFFGYFFEFPFSGLCSFLLKRATKFRVFLAASLNNGAGKGAAIIQGCYFNYAEIHTDNVVGDDRLFLIGIDDDKEVKLSVNKNEVGLLFGFVSGFLLIPRHDHFDFLTTADSPETDKIDLFERKGTGVVLNGAGRLERVLLELPLHLPGYFGNGPYNHLGRELRKLFADGVVAKMVDVEPLLRVGVERYLRDAIAGSIVKLHRIKQKLSLLFGRLQFDLGRKLHIYPLWCNCIIKRQHAQKLPLRGLFFLHSINEVVSKQRYFR